MNINIFLLFPFSFLQAMSVEQQMVNSVREMSNDYGSREEENEWLEAKSMGEREVKEERERRLRGWGREG